jgi:hypothetical protein
MQMNNPADQEKHLDALTAKLYGSICFEKGGAPPVERLYDLFLPEGLMIRNDGEQPTIMSVADFIEAYRQRISSGEITSFYEGELSAITEMFGRIAHRFSTYETKFDLTRDEPFSIGINSIQFVMVDGRWLISSIVWNNQTDELKIPEKYL